MATLTGYKDVFVGCSNKLHCFLCKESHILVNGIVGNILVGAVVKGNKDIEQNNHDDESIDVVEN
jgi:hypothetical protein